MSAKLFATPFVYIKFIAKSAGRAEGRDLQRLVGAC